MKVGNWIFLIFIILVSCQDIEPVEKPANLIPAEKMVNVLTELALLHGAKSFDRRTLERSGLQPEKYLFEKYNIDSIQFAKSNTYYSANPEIYLQIYDSVNARLEALKVKYEALKEEQERIADSIREAKEDKDTLAPIEKADGQDSLKVLKKRKELIPAVSSEDTIL
ncbi:MAG TPA: DUF4296 domain-containing protein [Salinimicrobium sp.]|nr:DUF4296 domain-containing protein [Salinimicrobium sp.]